MEEQKTAVEDLLEVGKAYAKTSFQLFKFTATDKVAEIVSGIVSGFVILILFVIVFINLNIGIAFVIGETLGKIWLGFLILAGFYGITGIIVYLFRNRWIKRAISNSVIRLLLNEEQTNNDHITDK
jgi:hypothetical protein